MGIETERKFLVTSDDWRPLVESSHSCRQGYFPAAGQASVRVRLIGSQSFLTIKGPRMGISRSEFEYPIPTADAQILLEEFCHNQLIEKTRHIITLNGFTWEIDEFEGPNKGLILAEVELQSPDQNFPLPPWVGKEVSEDERYFNSRLAHHPVSQWTARS